MIVYVFVEDCERGVKRSRSKPRELSKKRQVAQFLMVMRQAAPGSPARGAAQARSAQRAIDWWSD